MLELEYQEEQMEMIISILKNVPIPQGSALEIMQGNKIVVESADTVTALSDVNNTLDVALTIMEITYKNGTIHLFDTGN